MTSHPRYFACLLYLLLSLAGSARAQNAVATFEFEDHLKRAWSNELVFFPVDRDLWGRKDLSLIGPDGAKVTLQWATAEQSSNGKPSVAFLANVPEFGKASYALVAGGKAAADNELQFADSAAVLDLANSQIGLRLHRGDRALSDGPIAAVRLPSGAWIGGGRLTGDARPTKHKLEITAKGPVFLDAAVDYAFGENGTWKLRFRLIRGEAVVLVDETCDVPAGASWRLFLAKGWEPSRMLYRSEKQSTGLQFGQQNVWPIGVPEDKEPAFVLEPWLHWNYRARQGNWFSIYGDDSQDMLMAGAIRAASWLDVARLESKAAQSPARVDFTGMGEDFGGDFPILWGRRQWMLGTTHRDQSLADFAKGPKAPEVMFAPLPQHLLIKHGDFPLDLIKDYQFDWPGDHGKHPRLIIGPDDVKTLKRTADIPALNEKIVEEKYTERVITNYSMPEPIHAYLATGDAALGKHLCDAAAQQVQYVVDLYLKQMNMPTPGFAPHMRQQTGVALLLADAVMDGSHLDAVTRRRIEAQAVFIGYTLHREDVYSPERGYAGLPNMTTSHFGYKAIAACFNPTHPRAKDWVGDALEETQRELEQWSDENGGWHEAPHYAMVSFDALLGVFIMAHNAGLSDNLYHPKMKKVMEWFAKISTPPDSRFGGSRHLPPIGNTYMIEPSGEFGIIARLWRDKDPRFARQMQWMFHQQKSYAYPGIGGSYPALTGYRGLLINPTIPEEAPEYGSELFPETGVILRTGFPGPRETSLYMIGGSHRSHYDLDSGSITFWGMGRILCEDFGYYGMAPSDDHSMVTSAAATANEMTLDAFVAAPQADYASGLKEAWRRQLLLVKDADPLGANYAVICDTLSQPDKTAMWRLWTTSEKVELEGQLAEVTGKEDVDMAVHFALPAKPAIQQEAKSRTSGGFQPDGKWAQAPSTQNGLIVSMDGLPVVTAVLIPRLKTGPAIRVTTLAQGRVIRLQSDQTDDWVFISAEPFTFREGDIQFEGTVGMVRIRGGKAALTLPASGKLKAKGHVLNKG